MRGLKTDDRKKLRAEAEARFAGAPPVARPNLPTDALVRELQIHQIELEMANGDLRRSQVALEETLLASEARFREVIDTLPALVWTIREDGFVTDCNAQWCAFTGMTREQSQGNGWMEALHPDDRATTGAAVADAFASGEPYQVEQRLRRHDGEYRWFLVRGHPVRDSTGKVVQWHGANVDIHDRKLAEEALLASEERYR
jgi:PAS domain S-box-containing protein